MLPIYSTCQKKNLIMKTIKHKNKSVKIQKYKNCHGQIVLIENKYLVCEKCGDYDLVSNVYPPFEKDQRCIFSLGSKIKYMFEKICQ